MTHTWIYFSKESAPTVNDELHQAFPVHMHNMILTERTLLTLKQLRYRITSGMFEWNHIITETPIKSV